MRKLKEIAYINLLAQCIIIFFSQQMCWQTLVCANWNCLSTWISSMVSSVDLVLLKWIDLVSMYIFLFWFFLNNFSSFLTKTEDSVVTTSRTWRLSFFLNKIILEIISYKKSRTAKKGNRKRYQHTLYTTGMTVLLIRKFTM